MGAVFASNRFSSSGLCFRVRTCRPVYNSDPMPLWCPLNLLLVWSHQAEVKRFILGRNNVTRVRVDLRSCNQSCRKNDVFTRRPRSRLFEHVYEEACLKKYCLSFNLILKRICALERAELLPYPCILENVFACWVPAELYPILHKGVIFASLSVFSRLIPLTKDFYFKLILLWVKFHHK